MPPTETTPAARAGTYIVAVCLTLNAGLALFALIAHPHINSDFLAFWSFPRFAAANQAAGIYDATKLQSFQQTLYPGFHSFYPYLYPPTLLMVTWWLNFFSFRVGEIIWTVAGLAAFLAGARTFFPARWAPIFAMLASPAALITGATGETAFFTTALLLGGFGLLRRRKILAGILFGLLTLKPQLGILVPFALVAMGEWRAIAAAALTAAGLIAGSCLAFPPGLWLVWAHTLPAYQSAYFAAVNTLNLNIIVTPAANLVVLGAAPGIAWVVQTVISLAIAAATFASFWFGKNRRLAIAALFTGIFLAVPHAYAYDTIVLTAALALMFGQIPCTWPAILGAGVIFLGPFLLLTPESHDFIYAFPESIMYIIIIRLAFAPARTSSDSYERIH